MGGTGSGGGGVGKRNIHRGIIQRSIQRRSDRGLGVKGIDRFIHVVRVYTKGIRVYYRVVREGAFRG